MLRNWIEFFRSHLDYTKLWAGHTISSFGETSTRVAMPMLAILVLDASPLQMGILSCLIVAPHLVFGIIVGPWIDRLSRKLVLIVAEAGRALTLASIPILALLDVLTIEQLYIIAFFTGIQAMLADTARLTLLPALVDRNDLVQANSASMLSQNIAGAIGPPAAGALVQLVSAPFSMAFGAVASVLSATAASLIHEPERTRAPVSVRPRILIEIREGIAEMFKNPIVAALTGSAAVGAFSASMMAPLTILYLARDLHINPIAIGLIFTVASVTSIATTLIAPKVTERYGPGPTYILGQSILISVGLLFAAAHGPAPLVLSLVVLAQILSGVGLPLFGVQQRAIRQAFTPDQLLGRVNATWRSVVIGSQAVGTVVGGALGTVVGMRPTFVLSSIGLVFAVIWAVRSPLLSLHRFP